ncbi:Ku protein [Streptomyces natalensis]|uniref:non-homologous end joining protein Ku n=1 Tax=Streptomyces natalensis TaxID=68242 RepID=UPI00069052FC|nr:Ku protein [Streptomyces natalensis]
MVQTIARLSITWGLVTIPVTVHAATAPHSLPLHQVHARCGGGRIRLRRVCEREGVEVPYEQVARGWDAGDGRVVVLSEDDLADLPLPSSPRTIDVLAFISADRIDPLLLHKPYYLGTDPAVTRPYALLRDAMYESGLAAVVRVALRSRESLALLRPRGQIIAMQTLLCSLVNPLVDNDGVGSTRVGSAAWRNRTVPLNARSPGDLQKTIDCGGWPMKNRVRRCRHRGRRAQRDAAEHKTTARRTKKKPATDEEENTHVPGQVDIDGHERDE